MSALTKIGVVLLVVTSLLLSSGIVVFVNKVDDFQKQRDGIKEELAKAQTQTNDTKTLLDAAVAHNAQAAQAANARVDALRAQLATKDTDIQKLNGDVSAVKLERDRLKVDLTTSTQNQAGLQAALGEAQKHITFLRGERDKLVNKLTETNVALTDANAKIDSLEKSRRDAEERAKRAQASLGELQAKVASYFPNGAPILQPRTSGGVAPLEGVVSSVFNAGGKPWASISLGSKDNVTKDMKFNVINNQEFLGYLVIQQAEPNEAVGVLEGPKVDRVKAGDVVKTQLQ